MVRQRQFSACRRTRCKGPTVTRVHVSRALRVVSLLMFMGLAGFPAARAQDQAPVPIHWTAALQSAPHPLQPGQKVSLALSADIDSGWHIYAFPQSPGSPIVETQVTVPDGQALALSGDIQPPKSQSQMDPTVGKPIDVYKDSVTFDIPLKVAKKTGTGKQSFEVDVRYQACNDRLCLPPRTDKVNVPIDIASRH